MLLFAILFCLASRVAVADDAEIWQALASGQHVALLRHALAPGTGDPSAFALGDCSTQRNLSAEGRAQATRIGARFRENGIRTAHVFSSEWCRCMDTARLLRLGSVEKLALLNSFYKHIDRRAPQTASLKQWLAAREKNAPLVLVTHQVNITALTGVYPASGELVVVRLSEDAEFAVVGSIKTE